MKNGIGACQGVCVLLGSDHSPGRAARFENDQRFVQALNRRNELFGPLNPLDIDGDSRRIIVCIEVGNQV